MAPKHSMDSEKGLPTPSPSPASSVSDLEEHSPGYDAPAVQRYLVVFVTSFVTMTACFSSTSLMSAATQIADEFDSVPDVINASNAGLLIAMGLSPFVWSPLINLVGRLYAFNGCILMLLVWTTAASVAPNLACFITFRVLSGFQGTFFHVTSQAILAEYFPPVRRGMATGFFLAGTVLGPPLGPLIAGVITEYTTWRAILWLQSGMIALSLVLSLLFLGKGGKPPTVVHPTIRDVLHEFNPAKVFTLMRYPNLMLTDIAAGFLAFSQYAMLATPRHILVKVYNLNSPLTSGLFFIAPATGFLIGTLVGGRFSDRTVVRWIAIRNGLRLPQDRLRSGYAFWFFLIPVPLLLFGWLIEYRVGGLAAAIVTAFFASVGMLGAFAGVNTYCAEVFPQTRQEAIATKYVIQYILSAAASGAAVPLTDAAGPGLASTVGVILVLLAGILCISVAWYGIDMQNWVDSRWPAKGRGLEKVEDMYGGAALRHTMSAP